MYIHRYVSKRSKNHNFVYYLDYNSMSLPVPGIHGG
uniref:Uncharacterized protein n=1 Tax=Lepeophtheirus salmonis TaxID=72036 RepID=A0A0K2V4K9_LEPSM